LYGSISNIEVMFAEPPRSTQQTFELTLLPGIHAIAYSTGTRQYPYWGGVDFTIKNDGTLDYIPELDNVIQGRGTRNLLIAGSKITYDATALYGSISNIEVMFAEPPRSTQQTFELTLLPGIHSIWYTTGTSQYPYWGGVDFNIKNDGNLDYLSELDKIIEGRNSTFLKIKGAYVKLNPVTLFESSFVLGVLGQYSTCEVKIFNLLPGFHNFYSNYIQFDFSVLNNGMIDYDPSLDPSVQGRGTDSLVIIDDTPNQPLQINAGVDISIPPGQSTTLGGNPTVHGGFPPYNISWTPVEGLNDPTSVNPEASPTNTTTYTLNASDQKGCVFSDQITVTVAELSLSKIQGSVTPNYAGITIDLFNQNNVLISSVLTSATGQYSFSELSPGNYFVELVEPLGYSVNQNHINVILSGGETVTVDFVLSPLVTANNARSNGYWKHQVNSALSGKGNADYSINELLGFTQDIFDHFYLNSIMPIQVNGVTFTNSPAIALSILDLQYLLNINQGGSTMYESACQHYLTLLLNVASNKLGQYFPVSKDGRTVSQAIVYIKSILGSNDELAKNIAETLNLGQKVNSGMIPASTPNILYKYQDNTETVAVFLPTKYNFGAPYPNPFNASTTLCFDLPKDTFVLLDIYDVTGKLVENIVHGWRGAGRYQMIYDGSNLSSGIYIIDFKAGSFQTTKKILLIK
jgi:hypothetical protein